jgi:ferritin-like metal-binding protein YciE
MSFRSLEELLEDCLQELHAAESHLVKELPALQAGAFSAELKSLIQQHIRESEAHERALATILKQRAIPSNLSRCRVVDVLLKRGREIADMRGNSVVLDVGLSFIVRAIETYEQCAYTSAKTVAEVLSLQDVVEVLETNYRDEERMEQSCTVLSEDMVDGAHAAVAESQASSSSQAGGVIGV